MRKLVLIGLLLMVITGCMSKPLVMNRDGLYKFTEETKPIYLLYYDDDQKTWIRTHRKVTVDPMMVIIYNDED